MEYIKYIKKYSPIIIIALGVIGGVAGRYTTSPESYACGLGIGIIIGTLVAWIKMG